jgi:hypothetical protein
MFFIILTSLLLILKMKNDPKSDVVFSVVKQDRTRSTQKKTTAQEKKEQDKQRINSSIP